jgi:hypothetical protein
MKLRIFKRTEVIWYLLLIVSIAVPNIISQDKQKSIVHFNLSDGFLKDEQVEIFIVNNAGRKKVFSGKLDREDPLEVNVFVCEIKKNEVNTFELFAKDRKLSISYNIKIKTTPVVTIDVSISDVGFHVMFSDTTLVYN